MTDTRLLLFDIDGTILLTDGAGGRAMARAARELFGDRLVWDGVDPAGGLDPRLLAQAAEQGGFEIDDAAHEAFRLRYIEHLRGELRDPKTRIRIMDGVREVIGTAHASDHVLGLLTGNYAETAHLKLEAAGFETEWFAVGAFGGDAEHRADLVGVSRRRYEETFGATIDTERVVVIGDTPRDVECARLSGCHSIAVATGRFTTDELRAAGATVVLESLADEEQFWGEVDALGG